MMKRIPLFLALALGSTAAFGVNVSSAAEVADGVDAVEPKECEEYEEEEQEVQPKTDAAVIKIFEVSKCGIYWYEAEDANGNRFTITQVTWGSVNKGHVDFGDGAGSRYCEWK